VCSLEDYTPQNLSGGTRDWTQPKGRLDLQLEIPVIWHGVVASASGSPLKIAEQTSLYGHADGFFTGLEVRMRTGALAGQKATISADANNGAARVDLTLAAGLTGTPAGSDTFDIAPCDSRDTWVWTMNLLGAIIEDLQEQSGTGGCLGLRNFRISEYGRSTVEEDKDDWIGAKLSMEYGL
jgi:hypothetical protein